MMNNNGYEEYTYSMDSSMDNSSTDMKEKEMTNTSEFADYNYCTDSSSTECSSMDTYAEEDLNPATDVTSMDSFFRKLGKKLLYGFVILLHIAQIFTGNKRTRGVSNLLSFSINGFEI